MHDERQRPRGPTRSIRAVTENKIEEDPKQLKLWSAAQSTSNAFDAAIGSRAPDQGAAPKFPLTEPIVTVPQSAPSFDPEISAPLRDEHIVLAPSAGAICRSRHGRQPLNFLDDGEQFVDMYERHGIRAREVADKRRPNMVAGHVINQGFHEADHSEIMAG